MRILTPPVTRARANYTIFFITDYTEAHTIMFAETTPSATLPRPDVPRVGCGREASGPRLTLGREKKKYFNKFRVENCSEPVRGKYVRNVTL